MVSRVVAFGTILEHNLTQRGVKFWSQSIADILLIILFERLTSISFWGKFGATGTHDTSKRSSIVAVSQESPAIHKLSQLIAFDRPLSNFDPKVLTEVLLINLLVLIERTGRLQIKIWGKEDLEYWHVKRDLPWQLERKIPKVTWLAN